MTHRTLFSDKYRIVRLTLTAEEHDAMVRGRLCKCDVLQRYGIGPHRMVTVGEDGSVTYESRYPRTKEPT